MTDRLLMPCFGTVSIYNMFDDMMDIVHQLVLKWERRVPHRSDHVRHPFIRAPYYRFGPRDKIDPSNDYTRLTLDAISLCSMSYR